MKKPICVLGHYSLEECRRDVRKEGWMRRDKPKPAECECDVCSDENCSCQGKRCQSCQEESNG